MKASIARRNGYFKDEIVPVHTIIKDQNGTKTDIVVTEDDGIREETTM